MGIRPLFCFTRVTKRQVYKKSLLRTHIALLWILEKQSMPQTGFIWESVYDIRNLVCLLTHVQIRFLVLIPHCLITSLISTPRLILPICAMLYHLSLTGCQKQWRTTGSGNQINQTCDYHQAHCIFLNSFLEIVQNVFPDVKPSQYCQTITSETIFSYFLLL